MVEWSCWREEAFWKCDTSASWETTESLAGIVRCLKVAVLTKEGKQASVQQPERFAVKVVWKLYVTDIVDQEWKKKLKK